MGEYVNEIQALHKKLEHRHYFNKMHALHEQFKKVSLLILNLLKQTIIASLGATLRKSYQGDSQTCCYR